MGKTNKQKQKRKLKGKGKVKDGCATDARDKTATKYSVDEVLNKAEECIDAFNYEIAQKFCQRALELNPDHPRALEITAGLLLEIGDLDGAKKCLGRAVHVCPETGHSKYMSLGQLFSGKESLDCYCKGIELMKKELSENPIQPGAASTSDAKTTTRELSNAYCSIADLYLTDLCFEDDAEQRCKEFIDKAIAADPTNPEAYQQMSSFLMVKDEIIEAKAMMENSLSLWLPQYQAVREGKAQPEDFVEVCTMSYQHRINTVKILIELEEYGNSGQILEGLVEEDDEVMEVWYLLGWMNYLMGEDYKGNARYYLKKAKKVAAKVSDLDNETVLAHIDELACELGPASPDDESDEEDDENQENEEDFDIETSDSESEENMEA